jgi:hypothetical protein
MPAFNNVTTATITLYKIEEVSLYQAELISTNGNIFHPYDINTDLIFRIYLNNENITNKFTDIEWVKYSHDKDLIIEDIGWGQIHQGKDFISITRDDVKSKCIIQADAYMLINNIRTCVASARITLIDVNELYSNPEPPVDPIDGTLWVNTSHTPPIIYSWNSVLNKWVEVGKTTPYVRNLIHNSNFWRLNTENYLIDNIESLHSIRIENINGKEWANLKSKRLTQNDISAGLYQNTIYPIVKNSDYCFSFLIHRFKDTIYDGDHVYCKIFSLNTNKELKILANELILFDSDKDVQISIPFQTLNDTENIRCFIGVEPNKMCDYYITQLSLYNTKKYYPWELAPEDIQLQLDTKLNNDHVSVFNALTREGTMEGIYKRFDESGAEHFYFNASHIKTGSLDGGLINGIGLNIKDDTTGESILHVYKDEDGTHIDLIANNLLIGQSRETASTMNYVNTSMQKATAEAIAESETYTSAQISEVNKVVNTKADSSTVSDLDKRVTTIEGITEDDVIVGTVTNSEIYNLMLAENERNFAQHWEAIIGLGDEIDAIEKDIDDNIKVNISDKKIVNTVRESDEYKQDLSKKVNVSDYNTYKSDMTKNLSDMSKNIDEKINKKANSDVVAGINSRVTSLESSVKASSIVSTVRNSTEYIQDLSKKVNTSDYDAYKQGITSTLTNKIDSTKVIAAINNSKEAELISKDKIDFDSNFTLNTIYTSDGINVNNVAESPTITIDNIVDNIDFDINNTDLTMKVYKIRNTNYITNFLDDANIYMNNNEMIKLLLYEIKSLKQRIFELENKGGE